MSQCHLPAAGSCPFPPAPDPASKSGIRTSLLHIISHGTILMLPAPATLEPTASFQIVQTRAAAPALHGPSTSLTPTLGPLFAVPGKIINNEDAQCTGNGSPRAGPDPSRGRAVAMPSSCWHPQGTAGHCRLWARQSPGCSSPRLPRGVKAGTRGRVFLVAVELSSDGPELIGEQILNVLLTVLKRKIHHHSVITLSLGLGAISMALRKGHFSVKASSGRAERSVHPSNANYPPNLSFSSNGLWQAPNGWRARQCCAAGMAVGAAYC